MRVNRVKGMNGLFFVLSQYNSATISQKYFLSLFQDKKIPIFVFKS